MPQLAPDCTPHHRSPEIRTRRAPTRWLSMIAGSLFRLSRFLELPLESIRSDQIAGWNTPAIATPAKRSSSGRRSCSSQFWSVVLKLDSRERYASYACRNPSIPVEKAHVVLGQEPMNLCTGSYIPD